MNTECAVCAHVSKYCIKYGPQKCRRKMDRNQVFKYACTIKIRLSGIILQIGISKRGSRVMQETSTISTVHPL